MEVTCLSEYVLTVGVLDIKNAEDWAMEKWSIRNKKNYATRHGIPIQFVVNLTRI